MPSWELFEHYCRDHPDYREQVLPDAVTARVSVEQGATLGWARYGQESGFAPEGDYDRCIRALAAR